MYSVYQGHRLQKECFGVNNLEDNSQKIIKMYDLKKKILQGLLHHFFIPVCIAPSLNYLFCFKAESLQC